MLFTLGAGAKRDSAATQVHKGRQAISTPDAPAAIGPYSQAIRVGDALYLAGQLGMDPSTGKLADGIEAQTRQAMQNLNAVLDAAGFTMDDVVQCQIFLRDLDHYAAMNAVYAQHFAGAPPARAVVQAARIPRDADVEIMMVAMRSR
ncbi:MAG: RidA family protein [Candidatus Latescibacterota bacterium]|nr:MAG: RidA family protein [Candidatus Latescibacterota bacterium]